MTAVILLAAIIIFIGIEWIIICVWIDMLDAVLNGDIIAVGFLLVMSGVIIGYNYFITPHSKNTGAIMKLSPEDKDLLINFLLIGLLALALPALLVITCAYSILPNLPCYSLGF